jgi:DNA-binding CsgD family transcriptional regulator
VVGDVKRLGQRDLEGSLAYLRELYAQRDPERLKRHVLATIGSVVPSEIVTYNELDVAAVTNRQVAEPAFSEPTELAEALNRYMIENPIFNHYRRTRDGRAVKISDFLTQSEFRRLGFYSEYWRKVDVDHRIALFFPTTYPAVIGFAIGRNDKDFSERDRLVLNLLYPHLMQAHANAAALERTQQESLSVEHTLEQLDRAVITLGEKDKIRWCTGRAGRWISEYFGPSQGAGRLPEELLRWVEHQRSALADGHDIPGPRRPLVTERAGKRLVVRLVAGDPENDHLLMLEERCVPLSAESLKSLGLTGREAQIMAGIGQGKTDKAIAEDLYVSPLTVKTHLQHIYRKLGVESRAGALSRALALLESFG